MIAGAIMQDSVNYLENPYQSSIVHDDVVRAEYGDAENDLSETAMILHQTRPWVLLLETRV